MGQQQEAVLIHKQDHGLDVFGAKILQHQGIERMNPWLLLESSPAILVIN